jgi:hypothetical protein
VAGLTQRELQESSQACVFDNTENEKTQFRKRDPVAYHICPADFGGIAKKLIIDHCSLYFQGSATDPGRTTPRMEKLITDN